MASDIFMPLMGLTMSEGTVVRWLKSAGATVKKGEAVLEIETDKATMEIEAPTDGIMGPILVAAGTVVPVGTVLSHVLAPGESGQGDKVTGRQGDAAPLESSSITNDKALTPPATRHSPPAPERLFATPLARRIAYEHQLDLQTITASGPNGRIVVADVRAFLEQRPPLVSGDQLSVTSVAAPSPIPHPQSPITQPSPSTVTQLPSHPVTQPALEGSPAELTPMTAVRRIIAERMVASRQTTAHVTLALEAEATGLAAWRAALKADGQAVSYNDLLVCIVAKALREHPGLLTQITGDGQLRTPSQIDIGLAVDTPRGLLVPVLRDVASKGASQIAAEAQALIERARSGKIKPDELSGGVFTISNLGMYEIEVFTPVINLPECAILGVGSIAERAVVRDGQVCARLTVALSLAFDHRIVDGAPAAAFLRRVKQLVEQPLRLVG